MRDSDSKDPRTALLDAAERLLIGQGYAALSTRVLATEAGVNHGLVHYYFGSVDKLLLATLTRSTAGLFERQRALYAGDEPFIEKWRTAMRHMVGDDHTSGYGKLWMELQAMSWNNTTMQEHLATVDEGWREILAEAFTKAMNRYGIDTDLHPVEAMVALVMTFNKGFQLEQTGGIETGHAAVLQMIDDQLARWEQAAKRRAEEEGST